MRPGPEPTVEPTTRPIASVTVLLARLMWTFVGPLVLVFTAYKIVSVGNGWLTLWDGLFGAVVALMLGGRWLELRSGAATTMTGQPATAADFRRYGRIVVLTMAGVWIGANVLGNHILA